HSRIGRFGFKPLGKATRRTLLHAKSLASPSYYLRDNKPFCLRLVAHHASQQQRCGRATLADLGFCNAFIFRGRRRVHWVLSRFCHRSAFPPPWSRTKSLSPGSRRCCKHENYDIHVDTRFSFFSNRYAYREQSSCLPELV